MDHTEKEASGGLRAAVIGLGIGRTHLRAYQSLPGAEVMAIADTSEQALEGVRQEFGVHLACSDYRELLERDDIEKLTADPADDWESTYTLPESPFAYRRATCARQLNLCNWRK